MIPIRNLPDCHLITDPDLFREVFGFMSVCLKEDEEADLQFIIADETDISYLQTLGPPEEWARIEIHSFEGIRTIYRVIHVTSVIFIPGELVDQISIL